MRAKVLLVLTLANMFLLMYSLAQTRVAAASNAQAPVLRGRALEIVDDQGRVRSTLTVLPADPRTGYPETVLLRLIDSKGRPAVKIAATEDGSALGLGGESDPTGISMLARGTTTSIKLSNKDGREQTYKP
jgi:DMSO/TMAO reductase YedYZ molybdopterin-dependent catalytic subunit